MALRDPGALVADLRPRRKPVLLTIAIALVAAAALAMLHSRAQPSAPVLVQGTGGAVSPQLAAPGVTGITLGALPPGYSVKKENARANDPTSPGKTSLLSMVTTGGNDPRTIYATVEVDPQGNTDLATVKMLGDNPVNTTVQGKAAILSHGSDISSLEWLEGPHVLVRVVSRGPVPDDDIRAVAQSLTIR